MAIPVHLQGFKAAGIYRVVFDKSQMINQDSSVLRLVVGYSEVGPFNTPVYVNNATEFRALFGGISKKLEKRGIYFHRLALQMLSVGPILCLNMKKFAGEHVSGSTINTSTNPVFAPIETVELKLEDIYDTSRFWTLDANKLIDLRAIDGSVLDQYINIATTNTIKTSASYFIRKASGSKVSAYNITLDSWYSDGLEVLPEYLEGEKQNKVSDYFAEIYVFKGKFTVDQVLASETLKNYFEVEVLSGGVKELKLKPYILDAYGNPVDTLDALLNDSTSGALGHYVGSLIPYFKDKQGNYASLDVLFNSDLDVHNMMMAFNTDALEEGLVSIDLSGKKYLSEVKVAKKDQDGNTISETSVLDEIFAGTYKSTLMGNSDAKVISSRVTYKPNVVKIVPGINDGTSTPAPDTYLPITEFRGSSSKINGTLYVSNIVKSTAEIEEKITEGDETKTITKTIITGCEITLSQVCEDKTVKFTVSCDDTAFKNILDKFGITDENGNYVGDVYYNGTAFKNGNGTLSLLGPKKVITSISRVEVTDDKNNYYTDEQVDFKLTFRDVEIEAISEINNDKENGVNVYGSSMSFICLGVNPENRSWEWTDDKILINGVTYAGLISEDDSSLSSVLSAGDILLASDNTVKPDDNDEYCDNVFVQSTGIDDNGKYYVRVSDEPLVYDESYIVRMEKPINQEIGKMKPVYLEGYVYENHSPNGVGMMAKVEWQNFILSTLTDYQGLRVALLNKSEIDYRYVIDTFESFPTSDLKSVLSLLCKEKQSAFCIANFPSVQSFVKCPYASFTDSKGLFNVQYVVDGCNKKKVASVRFSIPSDADGASFMAFYTPLKFSDGYVDTMVPSAGLVSNLFIDKYYTRQPYYIVAGPNYGRINASGLVGPDYKYTMDELQIIEPFGVNCMVYRPSFGTFINANQTAKQIPLSALSKVNVRELVIYLQDEIEKVLQAYQWEFNNAATRSAILTRADAICTAVQATGGLQAFKNIMDESNNGPEIIDNEMAVLSTHIEPGFGCGKMVHELTIYRTGQMSASIS